MSDRKRWNQGEANPAARLTWEKVDRIRSLRLQAWSFQQIADDVGCGKSTVRLVCLGEIWREEDRPASV